MATWSNVNYNSILVDRRNDAEFYRPEYIEALDNVRKVGSIQLKKLPVEVVSGPFGSTLTSSEYTSIGIPFIRISDLDSFFINKDDLVFISETANQKIKGSELSQGDLILSKVGNSIGIVSMLDDDFSIANISENNIGIRFQDGVDPKLKCCLLVYLNSLYGQSEILRRRSGNAQPKLNISDIYQIEVPIFPDDYMNIIFGIISEINEAIKTSKSLYRQAQSLLESKLGLDKLKFKKPAGYTARFSETFTNGRFDADFFQVPFRQIHKHLDSIETEQLSGLVDFIKGIEVGSKSYSSSGYPFLRVSNIKEKGIELGASDKYISDSTYRFLAKLYQPKIGELLLTKDGTPGICYAVDDNINGIISGGIVRLIPKVNGIPLEYLALVINSKACKMQIEQECSGALILHWKPSSIRKLRVPLIRESRMRDIADMVTASKDAQRKSIQLLYQAKTRVEQLVEEAAMEGGRMKAEG